MTSEKNTTADDIVAITRAAYEAYVAKDREVVERLIARDFHFTSPLDNRIDRATYFARCWPNSENITGFDFIQLVPAWARVPQYRGRHGAQKPNRRGRSLFRLVDPARRASGRFHR